MLLSIVLAFLGLLLLNISLSSLKKSVIRKWRQGFTLNLITSVIIILFSIISMVIKLPLAINNIIMFISLSIMTFSVLLISKMNGLSA